MHRGMQQIRRIFLLVVMALVSVMGGMGMLTAVRSEAEQFFQQSSTWYTKIPQNPQLVANSAQYVNDILINSTTLGVSDKEWSVTVWTASADTPTVTAAVSYQTTIDLGWNLIPIPPEAQPPGEADGHMVVISADRLSAWDFYVASKDDTGQWSARVTRRWDLTTAGINSPYDELGSCRACPAPLLHGLITYDEIQQGVIDHALAFAYWGATSQPNWGLYPCEIYQTGVSDRPWALQFGARLQLDPAVNVDALPLTRAGKMIARAMQEYGMIFVDNCGPDCNAVYAESLVGKDLSWGNIFGSLESIPLDKLRVVAPMGH